MPVVAVNRAVQPTGLFVFPVKICSWIVSNMWDEGHNVDIVQLIAASRYALGCY